MAEKQNTYLDLGFNSLGVNTVARVSFMSANLNDAYFEMPESSVTNRKIAKSSVTNSKLAANSVTNEKIVSISADKITAGTLSAVTNIGNESIKLDGETRTIKIYDGSGNVSVYIKGGST